ncbi:leucine-rich repeat domain-containing protein [Gilvimarinus sp. SDUM040013]|uniref:Leucine-rich repeat domain-containing protein n=1 Tax=Gilvimarinus gilvus TaxID=3058038 RepID=A0ABU4RY27_9GAMM|nr:leucine-rich repeat domain-containing protein [Gilvimarinus sp. SDUM040013]MDO3386501.1 leucine-rich repeat domain-containing protein [Gilvimarinus sp. SDUM040013]MDX6849077.1 leucine-rich repeat domain-containing protein [Gilvimarinus sp. SDUM040013]
MSKLTQALWLLATVILAACSGYEVSFNDNVLYTPKELLKDVEVADRNLELCIVQTIKDEKITNVAQLTRLRCTHAGIVSLAGLERFYALTELDLSDNEITDIEVLERLGKLTMLLLDGNNIREAAPLLRLLKLTELTLGENEQLACEELNKVETQIKQNNGTIEYPLHCQH